MKEQTKRRLRERFGVSLALTISAAIFLLIAIALAVLFTASSPLWFWAVTEPNDPAGIEAGEAQKEEEAEN